MKNDGKEPWWMKSEWLMFFAGMAAGLLLANIIIAIIK